MTDKPVRLTSESGCWVDPARLTSESGCWVLEFNEAHPPLMATAVVYHNFDDGLDVVFPVDEPPYREEV